MESLKRRDFLRLASNAVAITAIGAAGARFVETADAMPIAPVHGPTDKQADLITPAHGGRHTDSAGEDARGAGTAGCVGGVAGGVAADGVGNFARQTFDRLREKRGRFE